MSGIDPVGIALASPVFPEDGVRAIPVPGAKGHPVVMAAAPFGEIFARGLEAVDRSVLAGESAIQQLAAGDGANLHQLMIQLEESRLDFQVMLQVRNKLLEAYQDIMKMQV